MPIVDPRTGEPLAADTPSGASDAGSAASGADPMPEVIVDADAGNIQQLLDVAGIGVDDHLGHRVGAGGGRAGVAGAGGRVGGEGFAGARIDDRHGWGSRVRVDLHRRCG